MSTSTDDLVGKKSEELADKILDNIFSDEKLFLYLKNGKLAGRIG